VGDVRELAVGEIVGEALEDVRGWSGVAFGDDGLC
jgi:hypothetical protein